MVNIIVNPGTSFVIPWTPRTGDVGRCTVTRRDQPLFLKRARHGAGRAFLVRATNTNTPQTQKNDFSASVKPNPKEKEALAAFVQSGGKLLGGN